MGTGIMSGCLMGAENMKEQKPLVETPPRAERRRKALVSLFNLSSYFIGQPCLEVSSQCWGAWLAGVSPPAEQSRQGLCMYLRAKGTCLARKRKKRTRMLTQGSHRDEERLFMVGGSCTGLSGRQSREIEANPVWAGIRSGPQGKIVSSGQNIGL